LYSWTLVENGLELVEEEVDVMVAWLVRGGNNLGHGKGLELGGGSTAGPWWRTVWK